MSECSIKPGETDSDKKTVSFSIYDSSGLPASGLSGEGAVATFATNELQISYNYGATYTTVTGAFSHGGNAVYKYRFTDAEVSLLVGEKNIWLRYAKSGFRTRIIEVLLRNDSVDALNSKIGTPAGASVSADISTANSTLAAMSGKLDILHKIGVGRWKIQGTQLLIYDSNGTTVLFAFNLKDDIGQPSSTRVFERTPV